MKNQATNNQLTSSRLLHVTAKALLWAEENTDDRSLVPTFKIL